MKNAFNFLLRLYPAGYRALFADEMAAVFEEGRMDCRARGGWPYAQFLIGELAGILLGAVMSRSLGIWTSRTVRSVIPFAVGAFVSLPFLRPLFRLARLSSRVPSLPYTQEDKFGLMVLAAVSLVLIAGFSAAFVVNLRTITQRRGADAVRRHA